MSFPVRVYLRSGLKDVNENDLLGYFLLDDDDDRGVIAISDKQDLTGIVDTFTMYGRQEKCHCTLRCSVFEVRSYCTMHPKSNPS